MWLFGHRHRRHDTMVAPRGVRLPLMLPREPTAFFGRAEELASIARTLREGTPLLTVVGLGGAGDFSLPGGQPKRAVAAQAAAQAAAAEEGERGAVG